MIRKFRKDNRRSVFRRSQLKEIEKLFDSGLPEELKPALKFLVTGKTDATTDSVIKNAESRRADIASHGDVEVPIWYSPKPGSAGKNTGDSSRPEPGEVLYFTMEKVARTGKSQKWGTVLYLIATAFRSTTAIELGACAGISAIYLSSPPTMEKMITVEGSEALANIAVESLKEFKCAKVVNDLFDEAIDTELPLLDRQVDLAYIDGHHEKVATIHYFNKLLPAFKSGAVVIFDDISWSHDMREAWDIISDRQEFSHTIDLGKIGVCVLKAESDDKGSGPRNWDLQPILGRQPIGDPQGWKAQ